LRTPPKNDRKSKSLNNVTKQLITPHARDQKNHNQNNRPRSIIGENGLIQSVVPRKTGPGANEWNSSLTQKQRWIAGSEPCINIPLTASKKGARCVENYPSLSHLKKRALFPNAVQPLKPKKRKKNNINTLKPKASYKKLKRNPKNKKEGAKRGGKGDVSD